MITQQQQEERPTYKDTLIRGREFLLNRVAGAGADLVLNPDGDTGDDPPPADLAAEIKETLDDLKSSAMDSDGATVDYAALRAGPAYAVYRDECLVKLHRFQPRELETVEAQRAFWINLYNGLVLDAVIAFDVHDSVTEGWLGMMSFFRRAAYVVDGQRVSLEDMEHGILRGNRGNPYVPGAHFAGSDPRQAWVLPLDPRIHFALNCGGVSCPPIRSYMPQKLDAQLDLAARNFIGSTVQICPESNEVHLSQILRWYEGDFGSREDLVDFLIAHLLDDERRDYLAGSRSTSRFVYTPYDWRLNGM